jgi:hypothetical protein
MTFFSPSGARKQPAKAFAAPSTLDPKDATNVTWAGRGDDLTGAVTKWNNRTGGTDFLDQTNSAFVPTEISDNFGGVPATVPGVHCGSGSGLDMWDATAFSSMVGANTWHIFALVKFDSISADDVGFPWRNHALFTQDTSGAGYLSDFALTLRNASTGPVTGKVAQAYFNGSASSLIQVAITESVPHLIEWWGDGSDQHMRVDNSATTTLAITGSNPLTHPNARVGSVNFEGGWDALGNRMYELVTANAVIPEAAAVRDYFSTRYNVSV